MLWQVKNLCVVPQSFEVLFRLAIFKLAYLRLSEAKPSSEKLLIESFAEQLKMARVISIRLENLTDVLALESRPKVVRLEELIPELGRWRSELVTLLPVAPATQPRGVIRSQHSSTALATTVASTERTARGPPLRTGRTHLIFRQVGRGLPLTSVHRVPSSHHRVTWPWPHVVVTWRYSAGDMSHAELDMDRCCYIA
jgi:hypothetical protein